MKYKLEYTTYKFSEIKFSSETDTNIRKYHLFYSIVCTNKVDRSLPVTIKTFLTFVEVLCSSVTVSTMMTESSPTSVEVTR